MVKKIFTVFSLMSIALAVFLSAGCSSETVNISINDMMTETRLEIKAGSTVGEALKEAEISIGDNDTVSPDVDSAVENGTEITVLRYAQVTVTYNKKTQDIALTGATVSDAIEEAGIKLGENEAVNFDKEAFLTNGMEIVVTKLITVELTADGHTEKIKTPACTVEEFLEANGIELGDDDIVTPSLKTKMKSDGEITVKRVTTETVTQTEEIEYETVYQNSSSMQEGTSKVTQQGENGQRKVKYKVTYIDGVESEREVIKETVIKEAVDKIVVRGTKSGKTIVSKQRVDDCDGSGHGYFVITWSDGSVTYEEY